MSNESIPNCIVHKDSRNIQTRLDYMLLFRNETKAKIIRIMETWTDQKRAEWFKLQKDNKETHIEEPPEEALWVTMSYEEFSTYGYGTINHETIKKNVDELVTHEYMKRRPHPTPGLAPQYLLDTKLLQEVLNDQDIPSLLEDIGKIRPPRKNHTPQEKYPQGEGINTRGGVGKIPPGTGEKYPPSKNTTKNYRESTNNKDDIATSGEVALHTSNVRDIEAMRQRKTNPRLPALQISVSDSQETIGNECDVPTVKLEAMPKQKPDASVPLASAVAPNSGQDDAGSAQAPIVSPSFSGTDAAQRTSVSPPGAVQASIPKRPRVRKVTQEKAPAFVLTAQEQAFWDLWCAVWFNAEIKPDLTETAYNHVVKLAPYITTSEQLNSLIDFTRKDLAESQNIKRKMVQLGNMVHSYSGWKQTQQQNKAPARDENIGVSGLPRLPRREVKYG